MPVSFAVCVTGARARRGGGTAAAACHRPRRVDRQPLRGRGARSVWARSSTCPAARSVWRAAALAAGAGGRPASARRCSSCCSKARAAASSRHLTAGGDRLHAGRRRHRRRRSARRQSGQVVGTVCISRSIELGGGGGSGAVWHSWSRAGPSGSARDGGGGTYGCGGVCVYVARPFCGRAAADRGGGGEAPATAPAASRCTGLPASSSSHVGRPDGRNAQRRSGGGDGGAAATAIGTRSRSRKMPKPLSTKACALWKANAAASGRASVLDDMDCRWRSLLDRAVARRVRSDALASQA